MNTKTTSRPAWLTSESWPYNIEILDTSVGRIAYTNTGSGPTVLLVHCGTWSFIWRDLIGELAGKRRVVTFDAPGNGLSGGTACLASASSAVDALVRHLDLRDIVLAFHDLGGPAALDAACKWPDRVSSLAAINTFGWRPSGIAFRLVLALMGNATMREIDAAIRWLPLASSSRFGVGRHFDKAARRVYRRGMNTRNFHRYLASARRFDYSNAQGAMRLLAGRELVTIFGQRNDPLKLQPKWAARFPATRLLTIPGGYHFPMCDAPATVASALCELAFRTHHSRE